MKDIYIKHNSTLRAFLADFKANPSCAFEYDNELVFYLVGRIVSIRRIWDGTMIFTAECIVSDNFDTDEVSVRVRADDEDYILGLGINNTRRFEFPIQLKPDPNEITPCVLMSVRSTPSLSEAMMESKLKEVKVVQPLTHGLYSKIESVWSARQYSAQDKYYSLRGKIVRFIEDQHAMWCRVCVEDTRSSEAGSFNINIEVAPYLRNKLFNIKYGITYSMILAVSSSESGTFPFTLVYLEDSHSDVTARSASVEKLCLN